MSEQILRKAMELKTKLEEHEENVRKNETKRDTLLEQAKQRYGVKSYAELEEYREQVYEKYKKAKQDVEDINFKLESFFESVEGK